MSNIIIYLVFLGLRLFSDLLFCRLNAAERFIEDVLRNVGRQHVDVDHLTPKDLDQLSSLIADALRVVEQGPGTNRGLLRVRPGPRDLEGELKDVEGDEGEAVRDQEERKVLENAPTLEPQEGTLPEPAALPGRFIAICAAHT